MPNCKKKHCEVANKRESEKKTVKSEIESERVLETDGRASDQDCAWYLNRTVILPEQFDRALLVENDIDQETFTKIPLFGHFLLTFRSFFGHFSVTFCCYRILNRFLRIM